MEGDWEGEAESRYEAGKNGDNMLTHFQCYICHFYNIKGRSPEGSSLKDEKILETIRRASFDAF